MTIQPTAQIIRVENCHLEAIYGMRDLRAVINYLNDHGFNETVFDGFYVSYRHPDYTNENRNTLVFVNSTGDIMDIKFAVLRPE
jgi:hypothetical protein